MDERKKKMREGEQLVDEIYDLIYILIGNDTRESDEILDQMRQMPNLGWYVKQAEDSLNAYVWAAKLMMKDQGSALERNELKYDCSKQQ